MDNSCILIPVENAHYKGGLSANLRICRMKIGLKKNPMLSYLLYSATVMSFLPGLGCQSLSPMIELTPVSHGLTDTKYQPGSLEAGIFKTAPTEYQEYGEFVKKKLANFLKQKQLQLNEPPSQTIRIINGKISLLKTANTADPDKILTRVEIIFNITHKYSGDIAQSIALADVAPTTSPDSIRSLLSKLIESFLAEIYPDQAVLARKMATGWTKYDRQGRKLADIGDYTNALKSFRKAIDARPDDHAALYNAGLVCEALGDYSRAGQFYQRAMKLSDNIDYKTAYNRIKHRIDLYSSRLRMPVLLLCIRLS